MEDLSLLHSIIWYGDDFKETEREVEIEITVLLEVFGYTVNQSRTITLSKVYHGWKTEARDEVMSEEVRNRDLKHDYHLIFAVVII